MRNSTVVYMLAWVCAIVAELAYATSENPQTQALQGHALRAMVFVTIIFVFYRAITRDKNVQHS